MKTSPHPPPDFDENPPLDDAFFRHARPAVGPATDGTRRPGGTAEERASRLRRVLEAIVAADAEGRSVRGPIARARALLRDG